MAVWVICHATVYIGRHAMYQLGVMAQDLLLYVRTRTTGNQGNRQGKNEDSEYFVHEFHCLTLQDLQTLNEGHAGCGRPVN